MSRRQTSDESGTFSEVDQEVSPGRADRGSARLSVRGENTDDSDTGLWTIADAARYLQIPTNSIYKMTARRAMVRIPHIRIGRTVRFRRADLDRWLTLLTVSNLEVLTRMQQRLSKVTHGHDSQTHAGER